MSVLIGIAAGGRRVPGAATFTWMMLGVGLWCATSALHGLAASLELKVAWTRVQYVGIATVPLLWLRFALDYSGSGARLTPALRRALWVIPVLTIALALTNDWHGAVWSGVTPAASGAVIYEHGWWFWIAAAFNYALVLSGMAVVARLFRRSPSPFRAQGGALVAASVVPLAGNAAYLAGLTMPGLDPTPMAFAVSGALFAWARYRNRLFDLIPVARDTVIESLSDAVIVVDGARRILDVNPAARRLTGSAAAVVGASMDDAVPALSQLPLAETVESRQMVVSPGADDEMHFDVRVMPVRRAGSADAWVVLLRDVTAQRRAASERDALQARMQEQQRREGLSVLAAGLAHDFNNLLASIVGNADLLALKAPPKSDMGGSISAILLGAQRAADLVSKMLAYAGERHGTIARVDLDALVVELLDLLRAAAARHCTVEYEGHEAWLHGDPTQLRQVAMNLIINAAESVDEGTGVVTIRTGNGRLTSRHLAEMTFGQDARPGDYVYLEVRDNGSGIDEHTLRRIFMPFFTTKASGHGLGLAAVQGIVHGHRGALRVDSEPGRGSRFCVWFPLAAAAGQALPSAAGINKAS